jgi:hypothetical protein
MHGHAAQQERAAHPRRPAYHGQDPWGRDPDDREDAPGVELQERGDVGEGARPGEHVPALRAFADEERGRRDQDQQEAALDGSSVGGDRASGGQPTPRVFAVGAVPLRH